MNIPFEFSSAYSGTPVVAAFFDDADNRIFAAMRLAQNNIDLAAAIRVYGLIVPTTPFYLASLSITTDKATKVELGVYNGGDLATFVPVYTTFGTKAVAGGIVRVFNCGPLFPHNNDTLRAALRVTGDANPSTVNVSGDLEIFVKPVTV